MDYNKTLVMACATVIEEMTPLLPQGIHHQVLDFGLHINPEKLRATLQTGIDAVNGHIETILLGYGLCSQAVIGITSRKATLVVPRVDDCIAIFLGSRASYNIQCQKAPGTYYLTKGWIEVGDTPFTEYDQMVTRLGAERAARIQKLMFKNYTRLALINTGQYEMERYREYTRQTADRFGLCFEEIEGSNTLVKKMIEGKWDDEFVVVKPGETIRYEHFFPSDSE
ncbi:MAG: DUF1638 domain-containing protein [Anaerolineales bacterium]|nr:DUF1638 domain-containing protein [Anaerolineales bacterium]